VLRKKNTKDGVYLVDELYIKWSSLLTNGYGLKWGEKLLYDTYHITESSTSHNRPPDDRHL